MYYYRVVFSNEFGNSLSEWSNEIHTPYDFPDEEVSKNKTSQTIRVIFDLKSECVSPNSVALNWKTFSINEILNFIKTYDIFLKMDNNNFLYNLLIKNSTVQIKNANRSNEYEYLISNKPNSNEINQQIIEFLKPSLNYEFRLNLYFVLEIVNATHLVSNKTYIFQSEKANSTTMSVSDAFGDSYIGLASSNINNSPIHLNASYSLTKIILDNYDIYEINLSNIDIVSNTSLLVYSKTFVNSDGVITFEPIFVNIIYGVSLKVCFLSIKNSTLHLIAPSLFEEFNCIISDIAYYSVSTEPPQNISALQVTFTNSSLVQLSWQRPQTPNDYLLDYLVYRRDTCYYDFKQIEECPLQNTNKVCCKGTFYEKKIGYQCCDTAYLDTRVLYGYANFSLTCCGGRFYRTLPNYECCGGLSYVHVPPGQICCSYKPKNKDDLMETRISIGFGDLCCLDVPYFKNGFQKCCNSKIVPNNFKNYLLKKVG